MAHKVISRPIRIDPRALEVLETYHQDRTCWRIECRYVDSSGALWAIHQDVCASARRMLSRREVEEIAVWAAHQFELMMCARKPSRKRNRT